MPTISRPSPTNRQVDQHRRQSEQTGARDIREQQQRMAALGEEQRRRLQFAQRRPA